MNIRAVIFDLDGTLLDTLDDLTAAVNHALSAVNRGGLTYEKVRRFVGNGVPKLIERALEATSGGDISACESDSYLRPREYDACYGAFAEYYNAHSADKTRPYGGMLDVLKRLKAEGYKTAVVTNKYDQAAQALKPRFFPEIDAVVGAAAGLRPKPAPDGVIKAFGILGVSADESVFVGDGETDVLTAKNCGLPVIAVTWGFRDRCVLEELSPDCIIDAPSELLDAIDKIERKKRRKK